MQLQQKLLNVAADDAFKQFLLKLDEFYSPIHKIIRNLAIFDCLLSLTVASLMNDNYSKPTFVDQQQIHLINSSNPVVQLLKPTGYVSNTFDMSMEEGRIAIITGPNMGGKSSFMRQVALIVIMAQMGCYIPAARGSKLGIFDSIFVRMGAHDDIIKNQSTFQVEMNECSLILDQCTSKSLVLLDEIGRGTSTSDGFAIAYSILDYLLTGGDSNVVC
ncbi:unnamed protein product [Ambrosiozyma monospora]|uniref:Unnamed protein product n=1 Tax=Ambrosiozyma monospora TaxID=43982 RepID=A0ACB5U6F8_AMBMO|nr:unnamed protein product [Ambrosiozyma monospora]